MKNMDFWKKMKLQSHINIQQLSVPHTILLLIDLRNTNYTI